MMHRTRLFPSFGPARTWKTHIEQSCSASRRVTSNVIRHPFPSHLGAILQIHDHQLVTYSSFPTMCDLAQMRHWGSDDHLSMTTIGKGNVKNLIAQARNYLCPKDHPRRSITCMAAALSLTSHYARSGDFRLLEEIINLQREAIALSQDGSPRERYKHCHELARSLHLYYELNGDKNLVDEAIGLQREAISLIPPECAIDRAPACDFLADLLWIRYRRTRDKDLRGQMLSLYGESVARNRLSRSHTYAHKDQASHLTSCAHSFRMRYTSSGGLEFLSHAIDLDRQALDLRPKGHRLHVVSCTNLAVSLQLLYKSNQNFDLLHEIVYLQREILSLHPDGNPSRASSCTHLAASLWIQYEQTGEEDLLDEAIHLDREALRLSPDRGHNRAFACIDLALSLWQRYEHSRNEKLLEEAIKLHLEGLPLLSAHEKWYSALNWSRIYLQQDTSFHSIKLAIRLLRLSVKSEPDDPALALDHIVANLDCLWPQLLENDRHMNISLMLIYHKIIRFVPLLIDPVIDVTSQLRRLRDVRRVGADAFVNAVLACQWEKGLEDLEMAQGVIWSQRFHQRNPDLESVPEPLATELKDCLQSITSTAPPLAPQGPEKTRRFSDDFANKDSLRLYAVVRKIWAVPGLETFMMGETYETLCSVTADHPAVILVGARDRFYALILFEGDIWGDAPLRLNLTEEELKTMYCYGRQRHHRGPTSASDEDNRGARLARKQPFERYLQFLWAKVVKPVLDALRFQPLPSAKRPRLHWCPTGPFVSAPLHAAGIYEGPKARRRCCDDYIVSSYAPTLASILRAQRASLPVTKDQLVIMLLAEKRAQEKLPFIPGVESELLEISAAAESNGIKSITQVVGSTTIAGTTKALKTVNMVHIACHGIQDSQDATKSGFCLGDGRLTIAKMIDMDIRHGFLAFLSACETAKGSDDQPDQAMHLAAAMLFAGFKSVIATMWAISDQDGPLVAQWFYEELFAKEVLNAGDVAHALNNAVRQLRESGVPSHRWVPFIHMGA